MVKLAAGVLVVSACSSAFAGTPGQRTLTWDDRVRAQEAIQRVDDRQRIDAEQMAVLEAYWKISLTDSMLERELQRMALETRPPERLLELYAALGNDPFLVKECLARPSLVDRTSRDLFAFDPALHAKERAGAVELRRRIATGEQSPLADYPGRSVFELKRRALSPDAVFHVSAIEEERDGFALSVVLSATAREVRIARYVVPKTTWEDWWATAKDSLHAEPVAAVAGGRGPLPLPAVGPAGTMNFSGTIGSASDLDLFRFCAVAGDAIVLGLDGDLGRGLAPFHPGVLVFDETGTQLAASGTAWVAPHTGVYSAGVSGDATPTRGDYLLSIGVGGRAGAEQLVDLLVTMSAAPEPVEAGGLLTYTIVMTNAGPGTALYANLLDPLPVGTTYESLTWSATEGSWDCVVPAVGTHGKVSCTNKCFAPGDSVTFTITVKVEPCAEAPERMNTATVSSQTPESNPGDNVATATTSVIDTGSCDDGNACTAGDRCVPHPGLTENFDLVQPPEIPAGWTATLVAGPPGAGTWKTKAGPFDTGPNSVFIPDAADIRDGVLDSPAIAILAPNAQLTFRNLYDLERDFDGGVLEIQIGAGPFQDILAAGGSFETGDYTGTISEFFNSPIHGRRAWTGAVSRFVLTTVNLPAATFGEVIVLRWRMATDVSLGTKGQWIDTVSITGPRSCDPGTIVPCDDNDACTADSCEAVAGCRHVSISCDDGDACNGVEICNAASGCVVGTPLSCNDGDACNGVETCNPASGCVVGIPLVCAAPEPCREAGTCHAGSGVCSYPPKANGTTCDDGSACSVGDTCLGGACHAGGAVTCADDGDACTADVCDPAIGDCAPVNTNLDADPGGFSANRVDGRDLVVLALAWNSCFGQERYNPEANLDQVATPAPPGPCVGLTDFHLFMEAFGHTCAH